MATKHFSLCDTIYDPKPNKMMGSQNTTPAITTSPEIYTIQETGFGGSTGNNPFGVSFSQTADFAIVNNTTNKVVKIRRIKRGFKKVNTLAATTNVATNTGTKMEVVSINSYTGGTNLPYDVIKHDSTNYDLDSGLFFLWNVASVTGAAMIRSVRTPHLMNNTTTYITPLSGLTNYSFQNNLYGVPNALFHCPLNESAQPITLNKNQGLSVRLSAGNLRFTDFIINLTISYRDQEYKIVANCNELAPSENFFVVYNTNDFPLIVKTIYFTKRGSYEYFGSTFTPSWSFPIIVMNVYKNLGFDKEYENPADAQIMPLSLDSLVSPDENIKLYKNLMPMLGERMVPRKKEYGSMPLSWPHGYDYFPMIGNHALSYAPSLMNLTRNNTLVFRNPIVINPGEVFCIGGVSTGSQADVPPPLEVGIDYTEEDIVVPSGGGTTAYISI
jgi:hypothetical protein